jgi:hypothetical protein
MTILPNSSFVVAVVIVALVAMHSTGSAQPIAPKAQPVDGRHSLPSTREPEPVTAGSETLPAAAAATASAPKPVVLPKNEADVLVGPRGAAFEVRLDPNQICMLLFPENVAESGVRSTADFESKFWGPQVIAVRPTNAKALPASLAIITTSGNIRVNLTLRVMSPGENALTLVRFQAVSEEEAFEDRLQKEVAKRVAPIQAVLEATQRNIDARIRDRADGMVAERALLRNQTISLNAHARTDDHVIAHVERALVFGEDAYLFFEIENRSTTPFRLARATVVVDGRTVSGPARLRSTAVDKDPALLGLVAAGASARGVVVVRSAETLRRKALVLELTPPDQRGTLRVDQGIVLR